MLELFKFLKFRGERPFFLLGAVSAVIALVVFVKGPAFLNLVDLTARDAMMKARGGAAPPAEVVIVAVDERSVNELGRWPWPRKRIAELVTALKPAKLVAFDMVFSEPEDEENDNALKEAIKDAGNVVLGYFFRDQARDVPGPESLKQLESSKLGLIKFEGGTEAEILAGLPVFEFEGVETNIPPIGRGALGFGSFNIQPDEDGLYRVATLVHRYGENLYPTLALEALRRYSGEDALLTLARYGFDSVALGERVVPLDERGGLSLNYYGPAGTFATYSATDVMKGRVADPALRGKLVFVGLTEKAVYDMRNTPVDPIFPGVEFHATVAGNIIQERFLVLDGTLVFLNILIVLSLPLLLAELLSKVHHTYLSLAIFATLLLVLVTTIYELFTSYNLVLSVGYPVFSLGLAYLVLEAYRNAFVERKSRYIKKAFSTYVSSQVVGRILKDPGLLKLGGEKREVTILFSDVRDFTSLAEEMPPEKLVALLNRYLGPMTKIVLKEGGTLDKYIGDAIMAIFNAPVEVPDHPERACTTALTMMERLPGLNRKWEKRGYPPLNIGVGINTGEAVVGNMGADLRFDYTAIGDTVNLTSRLEGMNKVYGTNIMVSEGTFKRTAEGFIFRELDSVRVKGKERPVAVYELLGPYAGGSIWGVLARSFSGALEDYRSGDFEGAAEGFQGVLEDFPHDGPSKLYLARCREYIESPPPEGWDGVYVAKTK